ncbi:MAG: restriction endonuclease subunit S [Gammaproteobacteria bacterium]|nr:restriction endonuclease subunit S [Gammaproteobacteria bacterium]
MSERLWGIPPTWEWSRIDELGKVVSGGTPSTKVSEYWEGDIIWFAPSDLTGYKRKFIERGAKTLTREGLAKSSAKLMPAGSVMFSSRAPVGYTAINTEPATTNQGFKSIIPHDGLFNEYIYYYLQAAKQIAEQRATGTTFKELSGSAFGALPIPIAPICEQHGIVEKIEALFAEIDKGVESLKAAKASLDHYRKSLLKAAFEGRLTADWRARNPDKLEDPQTLLSRIRKEREAKYQTALAEWKRAVSEWNNSGQMDRKPFKPKRPKEFPVEFANLQIALSDLPTGWTWSHLGWCSTGPEYGTAEKSSDHGDVPVIRMGNLQGGTIDWKNLVYTSNKVEIKQYSLNAGDVLFNRTNSPELVGKSAIYRGCKPALFAGYLVRINQIEEIVMGSYLAYFLNSPVARAHGKTVKTDGVNQSNINATKLLEYPFPYCSIAEQAQIVATLDIRLDAMKMLEEEIETNLSRIETLRQSILKQAFSGKLVPQDPSDEPAAALLDRIKAQRAKKPPKPKPRKRKAAHP